MDIGPAADGDDYQGADGHNFRHGAEGELVSFSKLVAGIRKEDDDKPAEDQNGLCELHVNLSRPKWAERG